MSSRVTAVRDEVREIARDFDPARLDAYAAKRVLEDCAEIERFIGAIKTLAIGSDGDRRRS